MRLAQSVFAPSCQKYPDDHQRNPEHHRTQALAITGREMEILSGVEQCSVSALAG